MPIDGRHGIEAEKLEPDGTQVDALHRPVVHASCAEGAAIAAAVAQNAVGVRQVVAVLPEGFENFLVAVGMLLVEAVRNDADPMAPVEASPGLCLCMLLHDERSSESNHNSGYGLARTKS